MAGDLFITDGTTTIDLKTGLFRLVDWTPVTPPTKGEGVWQDSMLDDGRRLAMTKRGNARETFALKVHDADMDGTIRETQELRRLLEKARAYWTTNWQREPVWIEARGSCETNKRYAYVMDYSAERDDNPYQSPFYGEVLATMDEWTLEIERSDWLANPPGDGVCVQLSSLQDYSSANATDSSSPTQLEDDIHVITSTGTSDNTAAAQYLGAQNKVPADVYGSGIRFRGVAAPAGATLLTARLDVVCSNNDSGGTVSVNIYGELNAAPAVFGTLVPGYTDFVGRTRTPSGVIFTTTAAWTAGTTYTIASGARFVAMLQGIIDLGGWAAGNDLAILIFDNGSDDFRRYSSFDGANDPVLYLEWETADASRGRSATCLNEVYFANKHNLAQLTHAYYYDAAPAPGYTDIMAAALPANLFPAVPAAADILYLGIDTSLVNSGPFASVIFDIGTAANDIINVDWEYWNGAWVNLATVRTIDSAVPAEFFNCTGVGSVSFVQPADWTTTAVNGVTGYWIRCVIPAGGVGAAPTAPTQANRLLYTVVRPSVDIDELQVAGDIPALARLSVRDYTDDYHASAVVLATRSLDRGSNFRMYLNASDEQNIAGMSFVIVGATLTMQTNTSSPTGRCAYYNPGAGATGNCYWRLDSSIAPDFFGKYRAYLRVDRNSAVTDCIARLSVGFDDPNSLNIAYTYQSESKTIASGQPDYLIDFGVVDIPGFGALRDGEDILPIILYLSLGNTTTTPQLYIYDLILIPVDEWAGEFMAIDLSENVERIGVFYPPTQTTENGVYLDVDSLNLKQRVGAVLRSMEGDILQFSWKDITTAAAQLQANKDQQVFAMLKTYYNSDDVWLLPVEGIGTLDIDASARYLSMRGDR